ncbi:MULTISPECIES: transposase [unclassified Oceanobacter]|uniref:transposase n=2 Tax=Gammaproteobacteria TaxID=1236 RepID=UPI0027371821|nr:MULTISPECIES: transposase [unclassified Oceanobacter]MDP2610009.1 transposase [Oceanobacter sp. 1_MG-2023]MDP2613278.1 transposase [Oceanobacter sp. 2_MG-2023]
MVRFKHYDYNQTSMVVINYLEQLQPGTFSMPCITPVFYKEAEKLDLSAFHQLYKNDSEGRPAYDPAILLKIILFAYSKGTTSSREIQWCCETNIIFKALSCDTVPHFTTLAHFVSSQPQAIKDLFEQVLLICDQQGLLGHELFAIDGCKMRSNAAKEWSGTFKELEQKRQKLKHLIRHHLSEHREKDSGMKNPSAANHGKGAGRQVSFPLNDKRPPSYTDWMKHRVDSPHGKQIYSHRMSVVEPVFGNIGTNKRLNRFSLRSKTKVQGQWQLYCLVHNVEKLAKYGHLSQ